MSQDYFAHYLNGCPRPRCIGCCMPPEIMGFKVNTHHTSCLPYNDSGCTVGDRENFLLWCYLFTPQILFKPISDFLPFYAHIMWCQLIVSKCETSAIKRPPTSAHTMQHYIKKSSTIVRLNSNYFFATAISNLCYYNFIIDDH